MPRLLHARAVVCGAVPTAIVVKHHAVGVPLIGDGVWSGQGGHGGHEAKDKSGGEGVLHSVSGREISPNPPRKSPLYALSIFVLDACALLQVAD